MKSLLPYNWKWQWTLLVLLLGLNGLALLDPETAEAAKSMVTVSAMFCVGWFVWQLMNYE
jgi:hypothetical protein